MVKPPRMWVLRITKRGISTSVANTAMASSAATVTGVRSSWSHETSPDHTHIPTVNCVVAVMAKTTTPSASPSPYHANGRLRCRTE